MFHIQEHRVPRMLVYLIFILIYSATLALAQFCGQVTGNHLSYLYSYSYNDSSESLYAPGITADDSLLSCQKTEDAAVLKKETVMCNHLCALKLIPIVKIGNNSNVFNYTSEDDIPEGFEVISSLGPIYCARRHLHCGATKPLYWDTKTGELTLSNEFDSSAVALCYVWTNDSSQYKELTQ
ncbi:unnamed protein product [Bursaphelenchus okinawaensis]|uniref:Uncharacterized protein n=1 Tax=Bursaphelenchus okinawaensis TaxID=465554 RepID=A0A811L840_9BILA|nr:unnamed protein product [Bursaphelenchus okinawaensis]CAG9119792.1 unnamed protein product [Bursaphelenchus okinawaensis]